MALGLQKRKGRPREVKWPAQGHTARQQLCRDSDPAGHCLQMFALSLCSFHVNSGPLLVSAVCSSLSLQLSCVHQEAPIGPQCLRLSQRPPRGPCGSRRLASPQFFLSTMDRVQFHPATARRGALIINDRRHSHMLGCSLHGNKMGSHTCRRGLHNLHAGETPSQH